MYRFGFIVEQALGHITHGKNLQQNIEQDAEVEAVWGLPGWDAEGLAGRIGNWTVKAGLQSRQRCVICSASGLSMPCCSTHR